MKKMNVIVISVLVLVLNACSAKVSSPTGDPTIPTGFFGPGGGQPVSSNPTPAPSSPTSAPGTGTFVPPATCINLSGKYDMNTDIFTLTQVGCTQLTWDTEAQPYFNIPETVTVYNANDVEVSMPVDTSADASLTGFVAPYYTTDQFVMNERLVDSSGTTKKEIVYSFSKTPCNLFNPDGSDYLMAQVYINGVENQDDCQYWVRLQ